MKKLPLVFMLALASCRPTSEPCSEVDLLALEAAYVSEARAACKGFTSETCPALPEIRAKYKQRRSEWVRCGGAP